MQQYYSECEAESSSARQLAHS